MRILYAAPKYDYGIPDRGLSFEHHNFYDTLVHMGFEIIYFDFMTEYQQHGRSAMSRRLRDIVKADAPSLLFCVLFTDQFDRSIIEDISAHTDTVTFNWFCDDHWRFDNYSKYWAPAFNWVSTTAASALPKYERLGYKNVIKTQWACNHFSYRHMDLTSPEYDVTFVGQPHGNRRQIIAELRRAGIDVKTWGLGWPEGRLTQEEMISVFNRSRINLNLSNSSTSNGLFGWRRLFQIARPPRPSQIKGRNFEIPGCGAFLLTDMADNLDQYYAPEREIGTFTDVQELEHKVSYYLDHEAERRAVADAGYSRTLREHTYERRFKEIFARMGLSIDP